MKGSADLIAFSRDRRRLSIAVRYALGAALFTMTALAVGRYGWILLWPAASLASVSANYSFFGPDGFRKAPDGRIGMASLALHGPYMLGAWINSRAWTLREPKAVGVRPGILLGRFPTPAEAARFGAVIDVSAELPATRKMAGWRSFPMLDLVVPEAERLAVAAIAIEAARWNGPVLVCCALGYSRSACTLATWLLKYGHAASANDAVEQIKVVRPGIVLGDAARLAIARAAALELVSGREQPPGGSDRVHCQVERGD